MGKETLKKRKKVIILGAGGRDFHNFNVFFRQNPDYEVVAFTATQIPDIENKVYPPVLAGPLYPKGIYIFGQNRLSQIIKEHDVDEVIFAYSDVPHLEVMHAASEALAAGASFKLMGPKETFLKSNLPVISVGAVRTGCGKSKLSLKIAEILRSRGKRVAIVRHPMAYGNLAKQACQKFSSQEDLQKEKCTIEEREEYEHLIKAGFEVFAGVDYQKILELAEKEADIVLWDGGNNDLPFFKPDFHIVICDALRPGHEVLYHPGEANLRMADLAVINKVNNAPKENVLLVVSNIKAVNPRAKIMPLESKITVESPGLIRQKTVLVVEDGPTVTHGEMPYGAGYLAAKKFGAKKIFEPKNWAEGGIKKAFDKYAHLKYVLPALGYGEKQLRELEATINKIPCQIVLAATPIDLEGLIKINKPLIPVSYEMPQAEKILTKILKERKLI